MVEANRQPEQNPSVHHERTDVQFRYILAVMIIALILAAVVHYAILRFFFDYGSYQDTIKQSPYPLATAPSMTLPPQPRLEQLGRVSGVENFNAHEQLTAREEVLRSYGATAEEGFIHVPIDRAMTLLDGNLPVRKQPAAAESRRANGLLDAGEPNSGRMFRGKP